MPAPKIPGSSGGNVRSPKDSESPNGVVKDTSKTLPAGAARPPVAKEGAQ